MKKPAAAPHHFTSIAALHQAAGLPAPLHPLLSVFDNTQVKTERHRLPRSFVLDFYNITYKKLRKGRTGYGQHYYDFDEGTLVFTAPSQVISAASDDADYYGITLLFHPDFIRLYPLGKQLRHYGFFAYDSHEALHLSDKEKDIVLSLFRFFEAELQASIDEFSQDILVAHLGTLLAYANRFYKRQFITRKVVNHDLLIRLEGLLSDYFAHDEGLRSGPPSVEQLAAQLHLSPRYLSDMLRSLTGQNTQQLIQERLLEKAKQYLAGTALTVAEIAYRLGFEHPQSFSKLFKRKTGHTPLSFKLLFN